MTQQPRTPTTGPFVLRRTNDVSGVSGTGDVAEGMVFSDGTTVLRWLRAGGSTAVYDSLDRMEAIHGHDGGTEVVFQRADLLAQIEKVVLGLIESLTNEEARCRAKATVHDYGPMVYANGVGYAIIAIRNRLAAIRSAAPVEPKTEIPMPPALTGETDEQYTDRLTGADGPDRVPYTERRFRQCSIGYHDECSQSADRRPDLTDETRECRCPCHAAAPVEPTGEKP